MSNALETWINLVSIQDIDSVVNLYADDGVLLGTFSDKIRQGNVLPKELTLLDAQIAEKIFDRAQKSSEDWKDWFLDWFRTSADVNGSLSTGFESLRVIRKPGGAVDRIVFTNLNASGSRSEAQESMTYQELVRLAGGEAEANYIITRTGG